MNTVSPIRFSSLVWLLTLLIIASSCSVEKRFHTKGFHVHKTRKMESKIIHDKTKQELAPTLETPEVLEKIEHVPLTLQEKAFSSTDSSKVETNVNRSNSEAHISQPMKDIFQPLDVEPAEQGQPQKRANNHKRAMSFFWFSVLTFILAVLTLFMGINGADMFLILSILLALTTIILSILGLFSGAKAYREKRYENAQHNRAHIAPIILGLGGLWVVAGLTLLAPLPATAVSILIFLPMFAAVNIMFEQEKKRKILMMTALILSAVSFVGGFVSRGTSATIFFAIGAVICIFMLYLIFDNSPPKK
jgi:MFS family permease